MVKGMQNLIENLKSRKPKQQTQKTQNGVSSDPSTGNPVVVWAIVVSLLALVLILINYSNFGPFKSSSEKIYNAPTELYKPPVAKKTGFGLAENNRLSTYVIQAEDYDQGGPGVAYQDTSEGNSGDSYRDDDVDIEITSDVGKGYSLGWMSSNEWVVYTFDVEDVGTYDMSVRVARDGPDDSSEPDFGLEVDGRDVSGKLYAPDTDGWQRWQTVSAGKINLGAGKHKLALRINNNSNKKNLMNINWIKFAPADEQLDFANPDTEEAVAVIPSIPDSAPSTPSVNDSEIYKSPEEDYNTAPTPSPTITGTESAPNPPPVPVYYQSVTQVPSSGDVKPFIIEAEDYDQGGQETAYWDAVPGNEGEEYRNDDVDIEEALDSSGVYNVGWMYADEWMVYTFDVEAGGSYDISTRVARQLWGNGDAPANFHLEIDDQDVSGTVSVMDTGGWHKWITIDAGTVKLSAGQHRLAFIMHDNGGRTNLMNLNWIRFTPAGVDETVPSPTPTPEPVTPPPAPTPEPLTTPKAFIVQAEDYDQGGQEAAYWDTDLGNQGGEYRNDDVDIEKAIDSGDGYNVGWISANEWMLYTFDVEGPGLYDIFTRVSRQLWEGDVPSDFHIEIDGKDVSGTVSVPNTGGWHEWITINAGAVKLSEGSHKLAFRVHSNDGHGHLMNLNWIRFAPSGAEEVIPPPPLPDPVPTPEPGSDTGRRDSLMPVWYTSWTLPWSARFEEADEYFEHLDRIGVTGVTVILLPSDGDKLSLPNAYGHTAGTGGYGDQITLYQEYMDDFRVMLDSAYEHNIRIAPVVAWGSEFVTPGLVNVDNSYGVGKQVGEMLGDHPAIEWWMMGGDMYEGVGSPDVWAELVRGLRDGGADQRTGYHNPGGGMHHADEPWNKVQMYQTGHCGEVDTDSLRSAVNSVPSDSLAGQGEPPYYDFEAGWCSDYHTVNAGDIEQSMKASIDAGVDFHVYGDATQVTWSSCDWSNSCGGWDTVKSSFGNAGEQAWINIAYPNGNNPIPQPDPIPAPAPDPEPTPAPAPPPPSPSPSDDGYGPREMSCSGTNLSPGDDLQYHADRNESGTTFCLSAGTYYDQSVVAKNGQSFIGEFGTILDGRRNVEYAFYGDADDVTIMNMVIENYDTPSQFGAIRAGDHSTETDGWVVKYNEIRYNEAGIRIGSTAEIANNYVHHNNQIGISGSGLNTVIDHNEIAFNNWQQDYQWGWEAGGTKFTSSQNLVISNNYSHDNHGPGLWTDINNVNTLYEGNLLVNNAANGIMHEVSYSATIRNNIARGNGYEHAAWLWGPGILVAASEDVNVYGNTIEGNYNGIGVIEQERCSWSGEYSRPLYGGDCYFVKNVSIHDNTVILGDGAVGAVSDNGSDSIFSEVEFYGNSYPGVGSHSGFWWSNGENDLNGWQNIFPDDG